MGRSLVAFNVIGQFFVDFECFVTMRQYVHTSAYQVWMAVQIRGTYKVFYSVWRQFVVAVQEEYVIACGSIQTCIACCR